MLGRLVVVESSRALGSLVYLDGDAQSNRVAALRNEAARAIHGLGDPREGIYYGHHLILFLRAEVVDHSSSLLHVEETSHSHSGLLVRVLCDMVTFCTQ